MPVKVDEKYKDCPIYAQKIETTDTNPYFTNGDLSVQIYIENHKNLQEVLDDGDFIILKDGAGTKNDFHIVKLSLKDEIVYFEPTSDFLTALTYREVCLNEIHKVPIYAKILFTISNRTNQDMIIDFYGIPYKHLTGTEKSKNEHIEFALRLPSERKS